MQNLSQHRKLKKLVLPLEIKHLLTGLLMGCGASFAASHPVQRDAVLIPHGEFKPLIGTNPEDPPEKIHAFWLDRAPVTQLEYESFVKKNPHWSRGKAPSLFVDESYLKQFKKKSNAHQPVTFVSWFAAVSFCEFRGGRLPTTIEWEYVAAADPFKKDASLDSAFNQKILEWYGRPSGAGPLGEVKKTIPNLYGVYDMIGLVWEWTHDFQGMFVDSDSRGDGNQSKNFVCGLAATSATNRENYAAFMRFAFRGSLGARYSVGNLGFRCAYDK